MSAATAARDTIKWSGASIEGPLVPCKASASHFYAGTLGGVNAGGYAVPATTATGILMIGKISPLNCADEYDNSAGSNTTDFAVEIEEGIFPWANDGDITGAHVGDPCFAVDNQTVSLASTGKSFAGVIYKVVTGRVWVRSTLALATQYASTISNAAASGTYLTDEWTNPAAVSTTALKAATAMATDPQTVLVAAMSAGGIAALLAYPRNVTVTGGSTTADCPTSVLITGTDTDSAVLTETLALSSGSGTGVKAFKTIVSMVFTGASGGFAGTCALGIGKKLGFSQEIKDRAGIPNVVKEIAIGVVVTTGTFVSATTSPPNGTYAPAATINGTTDDFAVTYEKV